MRVVGIDTATSTASVAILEHHRILADCRASEIDDDPQSSGSIKHSHSQALLPLIRRALIKANTDLTEISLVAVTAGPGSFTGLRIGLSTVKGLVYDTGLTVVGVSTLAAAAYCFKDHSGLIIPLIDARRNDFYAAIFRCNAHVVSRVTPDAMYRVDQVANLVMQHTGNDPCLFVAVDNCLSEAGNISCFLGSDVIVKQGDASACSLAAAAAEIGVAEMVSGRCDSIADLVPRYLQPTTAEINRLKVI